MYKNTKFDLHHRTNDVIAPFWCSSPIWRKMPPLHIAAMRDMRVRRICEVGSESSVSWSIVASFSPRYFTIFSVSRCSLVVHTRDRFRPSCRRRFMKAATNARSATASRCNDISGRRLDVRSRNFWHRPVIVQKNVSHEIVLN